jgi:hypothetical protein
MGEQALRPSTWGNHRQVRLRTQHLAALEVVEREISRLALGRALKELKTARGYEAGAGQPFGQVLFVVPGVELVRVALLGLHHHEQQRALRMGARHDDLHSARLGRSDVTPGRVPRQMLVRSVVLPFVARVARAEWGM